MIGNKDLYKLTADLTVVEDTPEDVESVWEGLWELVYKNYMDFVGSDIRGFAKFGYNGDGKPAACLSNAFIQEHGISPQTTIFLINHASRTPTLVTVGSLNRDFTACILKTVFTALGNLCRGNQKVRVTLGKVGVFSFNPDNRFYTLKVAELTQVHPAFRNDDERLCEIANKTGNYQQRNQEKHTLSISNRSGVNPEVKPQPKFDLLASGTYKGKISELTRSQRQQ